MKITQDNYLQLLETPKDLESAFQGNTGEIVAIGIDVFKTIFDAIKEAMLNGNHFRKDMRAFVNLQKQWDDKVWSELVSLKSQLAELKP